MGLNLVVRLLYLLRQTLLEECRSDWVLLGLGFGGRRGGGLGCRGRGRNGSWLNGLYRLLCWCFRLHWGSNAFWLWRRFRLSLFGFRSRFAVGSVKKHVL